MVTAPEKISGAFPMFVSVTVRGWLVIPCAIGPNIKLAGENITTGAGGVPVPVSETVCMFGVALSAKTREALSACTVEGVNLRVTVQLDPPGTGLAVEQVALEMAKSAKLVPVTVGLLVNVSDPLPVFISVTVIAGLVTP
jgi:hypothetical protein